MSDNTIGGRYRALITAIEYQIRIEEGKLEDSVKRMEGMSSDNILYAFEYGSCNEIKHTIEVLKGYLK